MKSQPLDLRSASALTAAAACWGIATVITKSALAAVPPVTLLLIQLAFSNLFLWGLLAIRPKPLPPRGNLLQVGLLGLLNPGLSYTLSLSGLTSTTASASSLLWAAEPILIVVLAWLLLRERLSASLIVFSLLALAGVVLISGLATDQVIASSFMGNTLILAGVACCALYSVLARRLSSDIDPLLAVTVQQTFAFAWALTLWLLQFFVDGSLRQATPDLQTWLLAAISGVIYYGLAFWFYLHGLARVKASLAGVFINLTPFFGIGGAYIFLNEQLSFIQWIGGVVILASVFGILLSANATLKQESRL